ncbi:hypothetical protein KEM56_006856 [Ascosphaera pollenicola]|nr:hypothetical protein KEM56_006856 [Ascosphaera pollenicola]
MAGTNEYPKRTNAELIEILKSRGLPHTGKKADLVARLQESDKAAVEAASPAATSTQPTDAPAPAPKPSVSHDDVIDWDDDPIPDTATVPEPSNAVSATPAAAVDTTTAPSAPAPPNVAETTTTAQQPAESTSDPATAPETQKADTAPTGEAQPEPEPEAQPEQDFKIGLAASDLEAELAKRRARAEKFGIVDTKPLLDEQQRKLERAKRFASGSDVPVEGKDAALILGLDRALGEERPRKRGRGPNDSGRGKRFRGRGGRSGNRGVGPKSVSKGDDGKPQQISSSQKQVPSQADAAVMEKRKARFG